jgi:5-methylcytosine-specific restriction endonuclease McrA
MSKKSTDRKLAESPHQYTGMWIRPDKRLAIYLRDRFRCLVCGANLHHVSANWITLDHVVTQSEEKNNESRNLFTCCKGCNCSRQDKPLEEFASGAALGRIRRQLKLSLSPYRELARALIEGEWALPPT